MATYAYARVSTDGQSLEAQVRELKAAGAERVFREKMSGAIGDRVTRKRNNGSRLHCFWHEIGTYLTAAQATRRRCWL